MAPPFYRHADLRVILLRCRRLLPRLMLRRRRYCCHVAATPIRLRAAMLLRLLCLALRVVDKMILPIRFRAMIVCCRH